MPFWNPLIGGGSKVLELEITTDTTNYNIKTAADTEAGGDSAGYSKIILTIPSTVKVGSPSPGTYALDVGAFNPYQDIEIVNDGAVVGRGGTAGNGRIGGGSQSLEGPGGGAGGRAMKAPGSAKSVTFVNNGILAGGGGGGDGGTKQISQTQTPVPPQGGKQNQAKPPQHVQNEYPGVGGGGGAGYPIGTGGTGAARNQAGQVTYPGGVPAIIQGSGPYTFIGGGQPGNFPPGYNDRGGRGGNLGQAGGSDGPAGGPTSPGGATGPYLDGTQYVTIQGTAGQGPSQTT